MSQDGGDHIDLSELILFINYENANGEFGVYCIDDVELSEGNILFFVASVEESNKIQRQCEVYSMC